MEAELFKLALEPTLALMLRGGVAVGGKLDLVMYPTRMCLEAFVESFWWKGSSALSCNL